MQKINLENKTYEQLLFKYKIQVGKNINCDLFFIEFFYVFLIKSLIHYFLTKTKGLFILQESLNKCNK